MLTKVDANATDAFMGLNENDQEPVIINKNTDVTYYQEPKEILTNTNATGVNTDADMGLNNDSILKKYYYCNSKLSPSIDFNNR